MAGAAAIPVIIQVLKALTPKLAKQIGRGTKGLTKSLKKENPEGMSDFLFDSLLPGSLERPAVGGASDLVRFLGATGLDGLIRAIFGGGNPFATGADPPVDPQLLMSNSPVRGLMDIIAPAQPPPIHTPTQRIQ